MDKMYIVRGKDGSVDIEASGEAFKKSLTDWVGANEISNDRLDAALDSVFDENKDQKRLPKSGLVTLAVTRLNLNANQLGTVTERLNKYVSGSARFLSIKGKGGGIERLARAGEPIPEVTSEKKASNA